jgi:hypothetical protein
VSQQLTSCPVCEATDLSRFDRINGYDGVAEILSCGSCGALMNLNAYARMSQLGERAAQHGDFYVVSENEVAEIRRAVREPEGWLDYVAQFTSLPYDGVFCDFGAGRGLTAIRASKRFAKVGRMRVGCKSSVSDTCLTVSVVLDPPSAKWFSRR